MLDSLFKLLPPSLLFGVVLYAGVCSLWLQPLIERRLAEKVYVPQCEARVLEARASALDEVHQERRRKQSAVDLYKDLLGDLGELPVFEQITEMVEEAAGDQVSSGLRSASSGSPCGCAAAAAFESIRMPMLLHVMSVRSYAPAALQSLPQTLAGIAASGQCGPIA